MRGCRSRRVEGRLPLARVERQSRLLVKIHSVLRDFANRDFANTALVEKADF